MEMELGHALELGLTRYPTMVCPRCQAAKIGMRYSQPNGTPGRRSVSLGDMHFDGYVCSDCEYETTDRAELEAAAAAFHREQDRASERRTEDAKAEVARGLEAERQALIGRTIVDVELGVEGPTAGFAETDVDLEWVTLTLDDGKSVRLTASGWHDIQSLGLEVS